MHASTRTTSLLLKVEVKIPDPTNLKKVEERLFSLAWQIMLWAVFSWGVTFSQAVPTSPPKVALQVSKGLGTVAYAPDGHTLLNYLYGYGYEIWDLKSSQIKRTVGVPNLDKMPTFTPDGKAVVCIRENGDIAPGEAEVRATESGRLLRSFRNFERGYEVGTNGAVVVGYKNDHIVVYSVKSGKLLRSLKEEPGEYFFSPNGKLLAVATGVLYDVGTVRLWDITTGKRVSSTTGFSAKQLDKGAELLSNTARGTRLDAQGNVVFSPNGQKFATSGIDPQWREPKGFWGDEGYPVAYNLKIWDTKSGKLLRLFKGWTSYSAPYQPRAFSKDGQSVLCGSFETGEMKLDLWNISTGRKILTLEPSSGPNDFIISADGSLLARRYGDVKRGQIEIYAMNDGKLLRRFATKDYQEPLAFSADNKVLFISYWAPSGSILTNELAGMDWRAGRQAYGMKVLVLK